MRYTYNNLYDIILSHFIILTCMYKREREMLLYELLPELFNMKIFLYKMKFEKEWLDE